MTAITLTPAERKIHRSEAHHLDPVVMIGDAGMTPAVEKEIDAALNAHGLIKIRVAVAERTDRDALLASLAERFGAAPIQHIGRLLVLWRPIPPKERIDRDDRLPGPRMVKLVSFSKSGNHRATVKKVKVYGNERVTAGGQIKRMKARTSSVKKKAAE